MVKSKTKTFIVMSLAVAGAGAIMYHLVKLILALI